MNNIGAGSLQIKKGIWFAVFYDNDNKKYIWRTTKIKVPNTHKRTKTYKDAERVAYDLIPVIRDGIIKNKKVELQNAEEQRITVVELIQDWINATADDEVRKSTLSTYMMYCNKRIYPFFNTRYPNLAAEDCNHQIMKEFAKIMKDDGLKTSSIRKYLVPIRDAFAYGFDEDIIEKNPVGDYKYSPKRKTLQEKETEKRANRRAYSKKEVEAMMAAIEKEIDAPATIPVVLALRLGLRREEILGLRYSDIDFDKKVVNICNTVTNVNGIIEEEMTKSVASRRTVPIDKWTMKYFYHLLSLKEKNKEIFGSEYEDNGYVYVRIDGKRYYPDTPDKQLIKFLKRNNLNKIVLHELRHTFCTILISAGTDIKTVQSIMGHEDSRMTMDIYTHTVEENIFSASDAIEFFLAS